MQSVNVTVSVTEHYLWVDMFEINKKNTNNTNSQLVCAIFILVDVTY